ncbi:MAG: hypothetical protein ACRENY_09905 [Candidatus Dormibacteria bacterium]
MRRPHDSARSPGCGCLGCSVPLWLLLALGVVVTIYLAVLLAGLAL